jgi:DNA-binding MarR family transcriptional regulator
MTTNSRHSKTDSDLVDKILELKRMCDIEQRIAESARINTSDLRCLVALGASGSESAMDACARMNLSKSRGSRIINRLIALGFVRAIEDSEDRRFSELSLTSKGNAILERIGREKEACDRMLKEKLDLRVYDDAKRILSKLIIAISEGENPKASDPSRTTVSVRTKSEKR